MKQQTLPCLIAVRDEINQRCRALGTSALIEGISIEQDKWTARINVTCENGERFHVDLDLLDVAIEGGFVEALTEVLH
jgi:hypothetical protein